MSRLHFAAQNPYTLPLNQAKRWSTSLGLWGFGAGTAALFVLSSTPLVRREVLSKVPGIGWYWQDNTPASDKPF